MVIPWIGFGLGDLLARLKPTSRAKYVKFTTLHDPERMPGQRRAVLDWPYTEGLRIDATCRGLSITECDAQGNAVGFSVQGTQHTFVWNSAQDNPVNYAVSPAIPIVIVDPTTMAGSCNPHANYSS